MVISLRRHRALDSRQQELAHFCEQEYRWSRSLLSSALKPSSFRFTHLIQQPTDHIEIYWAKHVSSSHPVVVKITDLDEEELLDYVSYEINTIRQLRHPNLLPLLSSFVIDRHLWNVVTSAEHRSVDIWSRPNGLPELAISFIIRDVLAALDYLHKRGIIHRAVCGSHILVSSSGHCMLTGLKYSTSVLKDGRWHSTIHEYPKNAVKLLNYLAPEILQQNLLGYNSKSDIYSVGIVCCELANGCVPFEDIALTEMLLDKLTGHYPRPLDSTCDEIRNFPTDLEDLTPEVREKYETYKGRTFSQAFHKFAINLCLNYDSFSRPTASALLSHSFIKRCKKSHSNLVELLRVSSLSSNNNSTSNQTITSDALKGSVDLMHQLDINDQVDDTEGQWLF